MATRWLDSPLGPIRLVASAAGLTAVRLHSPPPGTTPEPSEDSAAERHLSEAAEQLRAWFDGTRREFDLVLAPEGSPFQRDVWAALQRIPYGQTTSYGALAERIGRAPGAARAVGAANGANPIAIIVPCHRVIGADGSLTGYAGGMESKRWLLRHEGVALPADQLGLGWGS